MNFIKKLVGTTAVATVIATAIAGAAFAEDKVRWKMHSAYGQNVSVIGPIAQRISDWVGEMSDGQFEIKVFEPGALAGGYAYYDPLAQGAFEIALGTPGAHQGKNSAFTFFSAFPFGPGALEYNAWLLKGGGKELAEELYAKDGIKFMYCGMVPPETSGWFREEIKSVEQLEGMKMRFFGLGARVMQKLGVSTQQLAGGDIYPALELGTIDATEYSMPSIDRSLGIHQIAKYNYFPGWHQQSTTSELIINMEAWDALPRKYQAMIEVACTANIAMELADGEAAQPKAMAANIADGVTNVQWSDEFLEKFRAGWDEVLAEEIASNPDAKRVWDSYSKFHEQYKTWSDLGYLK